MVRYERPGAAALVTIDRPERRNAIDGPTAEALHDAFRRFVADDEARVLVLAGAGEDAFCAGADLKSLGTLGPRLDLPEGPLGFTRMTSPKPTIAAISGWCLAGGFELALWCGVLFCDATARFAVPEIKLGVFPPIAAIVLPWRVSGARSTQMILSGEPIDGMSAAHLGIADWCCKDPEDRLQTWFTENLEEKSAIAIRTAWRASRWLLADALSNNLTSLESLYLKDLMSHVDPVEGISAFVERRPPVWRNQ